MGKMAKRLAAFGGINLILLSIVIFIFPEILAYAVASLIMLGGLSLLAFGLRGRSKAPPAQEKQQRYTETIYYTD